MKKSKVNYRNLSLCMIYSGVACLAVVFLMGGNTNLGTGVGLLLILAGVAGYVRAVKCRSRY